MEVWLDDYRPIPESFSHHAKTANEAIEFLKTGKVRRISLDWHLGDGQPTGCDVADWMIQAAKDNSIPRPHVWFHSSDDSKNWQMKAQIREAALYWREHERKEKGSESS